ncbi:MAG: CRISPR system precrRNA processing endoribonuclease RAMP protein Cas6 [Desulfobulbaceae bacterium]|nr:CRISPR system precrRNA processing endoribonuclease RAMP protein Cas6 [Desulfobulbaceae bacterium]
MLFGRYIFQCRFTSPATLPAFKGSMLRGAFGHALKKVVCALRRKTCADCLLSETCVYSLIFEPHAIPADRGNNRTRTAVRPHPYVLQPPADNGRAYEKGDAFLFGLTFFGTANDFLPHIIYAVAQMGETGLGRKEENGRGCFNLAAVEADGVRLYDGDKKILLQGHTLKALDLLPPPTNHVTSLTVKLLTPLRLKHDNRFQQTLPFHLLIRAALRRISTLEEAFGQGEPQLDYRGLVSRAEQVVTKESDCCWVDIERYSNRQKTGMLMGGLLGTLIYEGELAEFLPLLEYCEVTHLGKQTAFGLGRILIGAGDGE